MYILEETETTLINYLSSSLADSALTYYKGIDDDEKETPCVMVQCVNADEDFPGSGIWHVTTRIMEIYPYEDSGSLTIRNDKYNKLTKQLYDNSNILTDLTGSNSNVAVYDIYSKGITNSIQQNHWVGEHELELVATVIT